MQLQVTEWSHPDCDGTLILRGNAEVTGAQAMMIMAPNSDTAPMPVERTMSEDEFAALPEFDG